MIEEVEWEFFRTDAVYVCAVRFGQWRRIRTVAFGPRMGEVAAVAASVWDVVWGAVRSTLADPRTLKVPAETHDRLVGEMERSGEP